MNDISSKQKLVEDLKTVVEDAKIVLQETAGQAGEKASAARVKLEENLKRAQAKLSAAEKVLIDKTKQAAVATDKYIHENPYKAIGVGAALGFLLGYLIRGSQK